MKYPFARLLSAVLAGITLNAFAMPIGVESQPDCTPALNAQSQQPPVPNTQRPQPPAWVQERRAEREQRRFEPRGFVRQHEINRPGVRGWAIERHAERPLPGGMSREWQISRHSYHFPERPQQSAVEPAQPEQAPLGQKQNCPGTWYPPQGAFGRPFPPFSGPGRGMSPFGHRFPFGGNRFAPFAGGRYPMLPPAPYFPQPQLQTQPTPAPAAKVEEKPAAAPATETIEPIEPVETTPAQTEESIEEIPVQPEPALEEAAAPEISDSDNDGVNDPGDFCADTPANTEVNAFGCPLAERIVLRGVNFKTDSAELTENSISILNSVANTLVDHAEINVEVAGHTDSDGEDAYNKELSQKRAESVVIYLASKGVKIENLTAKGYGEEQPVADNATPEGKAENRRVELNRLN